MLGTILIVVLILMLIGALPSWPHQYTVGVIPERRTWVSVGNCADSA